MASKKRRNPTRTIYLGSFLAGPNGPKVSIQAEALADALVIVRALMLAHPPTASNASAYVYPRTVNEDGRRVGDDGEFLFKASGVGGRWYERGEEPPAPPARDLAAERRAQLVELWARVDAGQADEQWVRTHYGPRPNPKRTRGRK